MWTFSTTSRLQEMTLMPRRPVPAPLISMLRRMTRSFAPGVLMMTPVVPELRTEAMCPPPSIVIGLVMVTVPKPPSSSALISPPVAVLEIAPANVLQGAVLEQGFASSPTPETHVRVACAWAAPANAMIVSARISFIEVERISVLQRKMLLLSRDWARRGTRYSDVAQVRAANHMQL